MVFGVIRKGIKEMPNGEPWIAPVVDLLMYRMCVYGFSF